MMMQKKLKYKQQNTTEVFIAVNVKEIKITVYVLELAAAPLWCDRSGPWIEVHHLLHWPRRYGNDTASTRSACSLCVSDQCLGISAGSCAKQNSLHNR